MKKTKRCYHSSCARPSLIKNQLNKVHNWLTVCIIKMKNMTDRRRISDAHSKWLCKPCKTESKTQCWQNKSALGTLQKIQDWLQQNGTSICQRSVNINWEKFQDTMRCENSWKGQTQQIIHNKKSLDYCIDWNWKNTKKCF